MKGCGSIWNTHLEKLIHTAPRLPHLFPILFVLIHPPFFLFVLFVCSLVPYLENSNRVFQPPSSLHHYLQLILFHAISFSVGEAKVCSVSYSLFYLRLFIVLGHCCIFIWVWSNSCVFGFFIPFTEMGLSENLGFVCLLQADYLC